MKDLETTFKDYMSSTGFTFSKYDSVLTDNLKLLFNISGGVRYEDVIAQIKTSENVRVSNIQPCIRTDSWDKIGISTKNHLAFQMLGHFSFYELSKKETKELMLNTALTFLLSEIGLKVKNTHATYHPDDNISKSFLDKSGILSLPNKENISVDAKCVRSGYRVELWHGHQPDKHIELWNIVFHERDMVSGQNLDIISADSGMSIERLLSAYEGVDSNYKNSQWRPRIECISSICPNLDINKTQRVADMFNAAIILVNDGVLPGNKAQQYVTRKIIREIATISYLEKMDFTPVLDNYVPLYFKDREDDAKKFKNIFLNESNKFKICLDNGEKNLRKIFNKHGTLTTSDYEFVAKTHGTPVDISKRMNFTI